MIKKTFITMGLSTALTKKTFYLQSFSEKTFLTQLRKIKLKSRQDHATEIQENPDYDLLIIGGGASGVGTLLNSSVKGLRTLLIDSNDFGASTSSKSTKLLHGGLRYLENAFKPLNKNRKQDFELVNEALKERDLLLNNAPYITNQIGMVIPVTNFFMLGFYYIGAKFYSFYANYARNNYLSGLPIKMKKSVMVTRKELRKLFPGIGDKYKYGVLMWDGQFNDSRMLIESILTATSLDDDRLKPANVLNYAKFEEFIKNEEGKIKGAVIYDKINNKRITVNCKAVVNCTGVFSDRIRQSANEDLKPVMMSAKGDHITLKNNITTNKEIGLLIPKTSDGRLAFVLPWRGVVIGGTTDKEVDSPVVHPLPDGDSVSTILNEISKLLTYTELKVESQWSGLRPLVKDGNGKSKAVSRKHVVEVDKKTGLISLMGGKWTIFRKMGSDAVDAVIDQLKESGDFTEERANELKEKDSVHLRLIGDYREKFNYALSSRPFETKDYVKEAVNLLSVSYNFASEDLLKHLFNSYGIRSVYMLEEMKKTEEKRRVVIEGELITVAEVEHVAKYEFVEQPVDLLVRRLGVAFKDSQRVEEMLPVVVDIFGKIKGWDEERMIKEYDFNRRIYDNMMFK